MAEVNPAGHVLEKTTRTRIIPESAQPIDFWDYIEQQKLPDPDHILYLYLQRDNRNIPYGTYTSHFPLRDGRLVPIDDREAFEQGLQSRFGGGIWRLILKCGKHRKAETRVHTGDGPTYPPPNDATGEPMQAIPMNGAGGQFNRGQQQPQMDGSAQIASKAIDVVANQESQAVHLGLGMMTTAADVMKRFAERATDPNQPPAAPAAGPEADLRNALTQALVARLAADPLQQFAQTLSLMREINNGASPAGGGIGRQMDEFRSVLSFARELIGGSAPAASTGAAIVNVLPGIVSAGVDIARAWQLGKESERDAVIAATNAGRPGIPLGPASATRPRSPFEPPPRPLPPPSPVQQAPQLQPNPSPPAPGAIVPPSTEFIEQRITEIFRCNLPPDDAARRALEFLYTLSGENPAVSYVTQLVVLGETGLVNLFHMRPNLKPCTNDMARLLEFIRAFLKANAEEEAERAKLLKPN